MDYSFSDYTVICTCYIVMIFHSICTVFLSKCNLGEHMSLLLKYIYICFESYLPHTFE